MSNLAPIILFVYNRPEHTLRTLEALEKNHLADQSTLFVFADGPRLNASLSEVEKIRKTREIVKQKNWCKSIHIYESESNKGLADSIVKGVTEIINQHGRIIVLEDDIVTSRGFLQYMNDALKLYENDERVMHISGYMYPLPSLQDNGTVFLRILSCWGWATWQRAWRHYSEDCSKFLLQLNSPGEIKKFNIEGHAPFYVQLQQNATGEIRTWAVKWFSSWYFLGGYALFPKTTLVENIGHDGTGVNSGNDNRFHPTSIAHEISVERQEIKVDLKFNKAIDSFYKIIYDRNNIDNAGSLNQRIKRFGYRSIQGIGMFRKLKQYLANFIRSVVRDYEHYESVSNNVVKGKHVMLYNPVRLWDVVIGDYSYVNSYSHLLNVSVGKFTSIGPHCNIGWGIHPTDGLSTCPMFYSTKKQNGVTLSLVDKVVEQKRITIGNDVFIGMNVTILDGVTIGDGAIIGAGAIVAKDIPPYAVAVGNPIKIIRYRFSDEKIKKLLAIKWWDFPDVQLKTVEEHFDDVEGFIEKYKTD